jgi:hypothetical protein
VEDNEISENTLRQIDKTAENIKDNKVGGQIDFSELSLREPMDDDLPPDGYNPDTDEVED